MKTDIPAETNEAAETESGTEIEVLQGAMHEETKMIGLQEETGIFLMTEEVEGEGDDVVIAAIVTVDLEADRDVNARKAQLLHPRRRNPRPTLQMSFQFLSARGG